MVRIRLQRRGAKKKPFYTIVAADSRMPRDGRFLERLGTYDPLLERGSRVVMDNERVAYWLGRGAQPTETMAGIIKAQGITPLRPDAG